MAYADLTQATLDINYLHANSTSHAFAFGAMAELVDNARDAGASVLKISYEHCQDLGNEDSGPILTFLDNGCGMSYQEASDVMVFGRSSKTVSEQEMIGMFGNGLKAGSMRLSKDMAFFTKKGEVMTCVLLSRTFFEKESVNSIIIPMPSFNAKTKEPVNRDAKFFSEMKIFTTYSPFTTEEKVLEAFDRIPGNSGTLLVCFNLKLLPSGDVELTFDQKDYDIILKEEEDDVDYSSGPNRTLLERRSFRAYSAILYSRPKMKMYINGKKVQTQRITDLLCSPVAVCHNTAVFKKQSERTAKEALEESLNALGVWHEAQGKSRRFMDQNSCNTSRAHMTQIRMLEMNEMQKKKTYELKNALAEKKLRDIKNLKTIQFVFGLNLADRSKDGFIFYNNGRLVKMFEREGTDLERSFLKYRGVLGVADVSYAILEPTHNKQDFSSAREYKNLKKLMNESMKQYWQDHLMKNVFRGKDVADWWTSYGYMAMTEGLPSTEPVFIMKRMKEVRHTVQCDSCLKWRFLPFSKELAIKAISEDWKCEMNKNPQYRSCSAAEEFVKVTEMKYARKGKTADEKLAEAADKMKALEEKRKKLEMQKEKEYVPEKKAPAPVVSSSAGSKRRKQPVPSSEEEEESEEELRLPLKKKAAPSKTPVSKTPVAKVTPVAKTAPPAKAASAKTPAAPPSKSAKLATAKTADKPSATARPAAAKAKAIRGATEVSTEASEGRSGKTKQGKPKRVEEPEDEESAEEEEDALSDEKIAQNRRLVEQCYKKPVRDYCDIQVAGDDENTFTISTIKLPPKSNPVVQLSPLKKSDISGSSDKKTLEKGGKKSKADKSVKGAASRSPVNGKGVKSTPKAAMVVESSSDEDEPQAKATSAKQTDKDKAFMMMYKFLGELSQDGGEKALPSKHLTTVIAKRIEKCRLAIAKQQEAAVETAVVTAVDDELYDVKVSLTRLTKVLEISMNIDNDNPNELTQRIDVLVQELESFREQASDQEQEQEQAASDADPDSGAEQGSSDHE